MTLPKRRLFVHNIGHHDAVVELVNEQGHCVRVKPESFAVHSLGNLILTQVQAGMQLIKSADEDLWLLAVPLHLSWSKRKLESRLKVQYLYERDPSRTWAEAGPWSIRAVLFPMVAAMLAEYRTGCKLYIGLMTSGPQREDSQDRGKSPEVWGALLENVINADGRAIAKHFHHNADGVHTYQGLPYFLSESIVSWTECVRKPLVDEYGENWSKEFEVVLSLNTGTTPRIVALTSALIHFKPKLFHIPQARRWPTGTRHEGTLLSYDHLRQNTAKTDVTHYGPAVMRAVKEMRDWHSDYVSARPIRQDKDEPTTERDFFFRKGRQEVLAVVVLEIDGELKAVRGVNVEVSLPTGTLCAERNAIGTALTKYPELLRQQIQCVAVLSLREGKPRLGPCGACSEWLRKVSEINPDLKVVTFNDEGLLEMFVESVL